MTPVQTRSVSLPQVPYQTKLRLSAYIAECLKDMIFDGVLKPGDKLPTEEDLCKHFNVSRTTLRESVQMLRVNGFLDVTPGRGSFVCLPNLESVLQDMALLGRYGKVPIRQVQHLVQVLLVDTVAKVCEVSVEKRRQLHGLILKHDVLAKENALREQAWLMKQTKMAGNSMGEMMLGLLLNLSMPDRMEALEEPDELMRCLSLQIKLNSVIDEGDIESAQRIMGQYFKK